jgi:hypothetical protein
MSSTQHPRNERTFLKMLADRLICKSAAMRRRKLLATEPRYFAH